MRKYLYELADWPHFTWDSEAILQGVGEVRHLQGQLLGKMGVLGFKLREDALLQTLTQDVLKSTEIEGEYLKPDQVRSSLARRLGIELETETISDRQVDGMVDMTLDATRNFDAPLTDDLLFGWHASLFPVGRSGIYRILVGQWRNDTKGPMQVVSGAAGKEKVHFQAPPAGAVAAEMALFTEWFNLPPKTDLVLKAAIAHLWFLTIHPFEDGNGRMARALTDKVLAASDKSPFRFYSMSAQIMKERKEYDEILEQTQKGGLDITPWITWFLGCLKRAILSAETILEGVLHKAEFWRKHAHIPLNLRQRAMLHRLLDGFEGHLTSSKWAKITKCSPDSALRDIQDLLEKGLLEKAGGGGRSTAYRMRAEISR